MELLSLSLLAVTFGGKDVLIALLGITSAAGATAFLRKKDTGVEERRTKAVQAAGLMKEAGLEKLSGGIVRYAVGDYDGVFEEMRYLFRAITGNPEDLLALVNGLVHKRLPGLLNVPGEREKILAVVQPFIDRLKTEVEANLPKPPTSPSVVPIVPQVVTVPQPQPSPPPVVVPTPAPPQEVVTKTEYVPFEVDTFHQAFDRAKDEFVKRNPGVAGTFETFEGLLSQFLKVKE